MVATKCCTNDPGKEVWLTFVKAVYPVAGYIPTKADVYLEKNSLVRFPATKEDFRKLLRLTGLSILVIRETDL